ncbi:MAG TPA: DUF2608 domain-containing protein [Candidatus Babeliales bacterium]|nr:DUF2608 domain-containing protein [Candidatus Babeliales bacterium]
MKCQKNRLVPFLIILACTSFGSWFYTTANSPIQTIHSFNEVDFDAIDTDTLVLFDVDETLVQPIDTAFTKNWAKRDNFQKKLIAEHPEIKNWDIYMSIAVTDIPRPLLEPMIIDTIAKLQNRGVAVIACTAMETGKYATIEKLEAWRYNHLASLGFHGSFANIMVNLPTKARNPVFYKGVLVTDSELKGPIVFSFLDYIHRTPKKIILFDDYMPQLKSIEQACKENNISFQGYHYEGAIEKPWDDELIQFQAEYLLKNKQWLPDADARVLMQQQPEIAY